MSSSDRPAGQSEAGTEAAAKALQYADAQGAKEAESWEALPQVERDGYYEAVQPIIAAYLAAVSPVSVEGEDERGMPWENAEGTYRDSRWRDAKKFALGGRLVCERTGAAVTDKGTCPVHGGDACLYSSSLLLAYWIERAASPSSPTGRELLLQARSALIMAYNELDARCTDEAAQGVQDTVAALDAALRSPSSPTGPTDDLGACLAAMRAVAEVCERETYVSPDRVLRLLTPMLDLLGAVGSAYPPSLADAIERHGLPARGSDSDDG